MLLAIPVALVAGVVSFASPCVLPLVAGYLGYLGGMSGVANTPPHLLVARSARGWRAQERGNPIMAADVTRGHGR